jgi:predicted nucleic acid-binding protein
MVPLCVGQRQTPFVKAAGRSGSIVVWWGTSVEMTSALTRLHRSGDISQHGLEMGVAKLAALRRRWIEVQPTQPVRDLAEDLLHRHSLRAADAFQLAAALIWSKRQPRKRPFVCFDGRLGEAARKEGFAVDVI